MKTPLFKSTLLALALFCAVNFLSAQQTEIQYLSGTGSDKTVNWKFFCTAGRNSGKWTSIPVPSNWELQGFGKYNYGLDKDTVRGKEKGLYKYSFNVPAAWNNKVINIVFEGSMTDTEVKINGKQAGAIHQGAFYCFKYDITKLLKVGQNNLLEVAVSKHSTNETVNGAERRGDYWIFGGIFRPVYLEALPKQHINKIAIDAGANGSFNANIDFVSNKAPTTIMAQITTQDGKKAGVQFSATAKAGDSEVHLQTILSKPLLWNPESPNLYNATFSIMQNGKALHSVSQRFGFRTVDLRQRDGIYVNGTKIKFKGVGRHSFNPTTGRALSKEVSIEDVKLMKDMNMNAVRMSHYPPDGHFLDVCDSLGLFVLDELAGWHHAYDTQVGTKLVKEMVEHDVNHPSIVIWDNGNEGGHNFDLDAVFDKSDIQKRPVIHPWQPFRGTDTQHYINYDYGAGTFWHGHNIAFPTEFLHGLYDGGLGAGLYDYWELMWKTPKAAGGFLWVFADEGVVRTDKNGEIDTDGNHAPDGILGSFHEKEGSYFAIKEIWSPIRFEQKDITPLFDGALNIENRYFYTNINQCHFTWKLAKMPSPDGKTAKTELTGKALSPTILPGEKGQLKLDLPANWKDFDVLYVTVTDPYNQELYTSNWPITLPETMADRILVKNGNKATIAAETDSTVTVSTSDIRIVLHKKSGLLIKVSNLKGEIPFNHGPVLCAGKSIFSSMELKTDGDTIRAICSYEKASIMKEHTWSIYPSGLIKLEVNYNPVEYESDFMGISFSYPEHEVKAVKWMGNGPFRVWKNRLQGGSLDVHEKTYNNTMTGVPPVTYPEFKGYHSQLYWAKFITTGQSFLVATANEDVFLRLFTPETPKQSYNTAPPFPSGDISFMQAIPAIGTKSQKSENMGPSGKKNMYFDYGQYDKWQLRCKKMIVFFDFSGR